MTGAIEAIIITLTIVILCLSIILYIEKDKSKYFLKQINSLEKKYLSKDKELIKVRSQYLWLLHCNSELEKENIELREKSQNKIIKVKEIPEGTIAAVRLAMKYSHPDNGGDSATFIKVKKIYDILTNKVK